MQQTADEQASVVGRLWHKTTYVVSSGPLIIGCCIERALLTGLRLAQQIGRWCQGLGTPGHREEVAIQQSVQAAQK